MIKEEQFIYQQIELSTEEWAVNNIVYPSSVLLFERLKNGKLDFKLADGVHTFAELESMIPNVIMTDTITVKSLTNLPINKYAIKYKYLSSSASAISFAGVPNDGFECIISLNNATSLDIIQPLPNAHNWQCSDSSIIIPAGKIGEISIRYIDEKYLIRC